MLVGVKDNFATHFHSKIVQGFEAFRMHRGGFMRNQDVSLAFLEFFIDTLENRRTVSAGRPPRHIPLLPIFRMKRLGEA